MNVSGKISTTIKTPKRELVPITVSHYGHLVGVDYGWLNSGFCPIRYLIPECVCDTYQEFYRRSYFSQQQYLSRLFCTHNNIPSDNLPKRSSQ